MNEKFILSWKVELDIFNFFGSLIDLEVQIEKVPQPMRLVFSFPEVKVADCVTVTDGHRFSASVVFYCRPRKKSSLRRITFFFTVALILMAILRFPLLVSALRSQRRYIHSTSWDSIVRLIEWLTGSLDLNDSCDTWINLSSLFIFTVLNGNSFFVFADRGPRGGGYGGAPRVNYGERSGGNNEGDSSQSAGERPNRGYGGERRGGGGYRGGYRGGEGEQQRGGYRGGDRQDRPPRQPRFEGGAEGGEHAQPESGGGVTGGQEQDQQGEGYG